MDGNQKKQLQPKLIRRLKIKILCEYSPCGPHFVRNGWRRVFEQLGHEFRFWDMSKEPAFDVFEWEPHIFLGTTYNTDRAITKCIKARPEMKVALFASANSPYIKTINLQKYPLVVASDNEKRVMEELKKSCNKPDFVFIHAHGVWLENSMSGWGEIGIQYVGIMNAFDAILYHNPKPRAELSCDIGFVGGYWGYKGVNLNKYLLPLCDSNLNHKIKIFGNQPWPVPQYLGMCSDEVNRDLFVSAKVCPNVSEPHSTDTNMGWDIVERIYKGIGCGGFVISDYIEEARDLFTEQELIMNKSPELFKKDIEYFINNPNDRAPFIIDGQKCIHNKHTYHHRVSQMLSQFGFTKESNRCLELLKNTL